MESSDVQSESLKIKIRWLSDPSYKSVGPQKALVKEHETTMINRSFQGHFQEASYEGGSSYMGLSRGIKGSWDL